MKKKRETKQPVKTLKEIYQNAAIALTIQFGGSQAQKTDKSPQAPRSESAPKS